MALSFFIIPIGLIASNIYSPEETYLFVNNQAPQPEFIEQFIVDGSETLANPT